MGQKIYVFFFFWIISSLVGVVYGQQEQAYTMFMQTFNAEVGEVQLNWADFGANTGGNRWTINGAYGGGGQAVTAPQNQAVGGAINAGPYSAYLHISDAPDSPDGGAGFTPSDASERFVIVGEGICTRGYTGVALSFFWSGGGDSTTAYGECYFRYDGDPSWKLAKTLSGRTRLYGSPDTWVKETVLDPSLDDTGDLDIAFRWVNVSGSTPPPALSFGVDDVVVIGNTPDVVTAVSVPFDSPICLNGVVKVCLYQKPPLCRGAYVYEMLRPNAMGEMEYQQLGDSILLYEDDIQALLVNDEGYCRTFEVPDSIPLDTAIYRIRVRRVVSIEYNGQTYPFYPFQPGYTPYLTAPTFTSAPSKLFPVTDCSEFIEPVNGSLCGIYCVGGNLPYISFHSGYNFNADNVYTLELLEIPQPGDTIFVTTLDSFPSTYSYIYNPGYMSGSRVPNVPDGCYYSLRLRASSPSVISQAFGRFCIRNCDIALVKPNPTSQSEINVCLDCLVETPSDIDPPTSPNEYPLFPYYICDTCPSPAGLPNPQDYPGAHPWNPVQSACDDDFAEIPVRFTIHTNDSTSVHYDTATVFFLQLRNQAPFNGYNCLMTVLNDSLNSVKYSEIDWQPVPNSTALEGVIYLRIPRAELGSSIDFLNKRFYGNYQVMARHPNPMEANTPLPGYEVLYPNDTLPYNIYSDMGALSINEATSDAPIVSLVEVVTDCDNDTAVAKVNVKYVPENTEACPINLYKYNPITHTSVMIAWGLNKGNPQNYNHTIFFNPTDTIYLFARQECSTRCLGPLSDTLLVPATLLPIILPTQVLGDTIVCLGDTVTYKTDFISETGVYWYLAQGKGQILSQGTNEVVILWNEPGVDTLIANLANVIVQNCTFEDGGVQTFPLTVLVDHGYVTFNAAPLEFSGPPYTVTFTASAPFGGASYQWFIGDQAVSTAASFTHTFDSPGDYPVRLIGQYPEITCGDTLLDTVSVKVITALNAEKPLPTVKLYPNPARTAATLQAPVGTLINITDVTGRERLQTTQTQPTTQLPLESLPSGVYSVALTHQDGRRQSLRLVLVP